MKSFFKRDKEEAATAPPPIPAISDIQTASLVRPPPPSLPTPQQRRLAQTSKQLPRPHDPVQRITSQQIRDLRDLIRYRYALDVDIWSPRSIKEYKQDKPKENMRRSDAALVIIRKTLVGWDWREFFASDVEYQKFGEIRKRLVQGPKAE